MKLRICYLQVKKYHWQEHIDSEYKTINLKLSEFLPFASDYEIFDMFIAINSASVI